MSYAVQFTPKSSNAKVGAMPVSTTSDNTCSDTCPLKEKGCYAKGGPLGILWRALSSASPGAYYALPRGQAYACSWDEFCGKVAALPEDTIWRHNQAGDLPGENDAIDTRALRQLVDANRGKRGFTYSHKPLSYGDNKAAIEWSNLNGFTINLSADNLSEADELSTADIGPVVVVLPQELGREATKGGEWTEDLDAYKARVADLATPEGRKIIPCPATYRDDMACVNCELCQKVKRKAIVGFPAHGASKKAASEIARN